MLEAILVFIFNLAVAVFDLILMAVALIVSAIIIVGALLASILVNFYHLIHHFI